MTMLVSIKSSSKNESKSQPLGLGSSTGSGWYQSKVVQRTKANHNYGYMKVDNAFVGINQK